MLREQLPVQERQLDGVGDRLDLLVEAADVGVGDVGHLFEDELFDLRAGQLLEQEPGAESISTQSPARSFVADEGVGELDDPLLVGAADDERTLAVVEQLLETVTTSPAHS